MAAALLAEAVGEQLTCVFVDHGLLRKDEGDQVERAFSPWAMNFVRVDAEERFLDKLAGVEEPERKRRIIGGEFIRVFEEEARKVGAVDFLARQLGRELGLPEYLVARQPFPGPGLAIRVIGEVTRDKLSMLREADAIFQEEMARSGQERQLSQFFAALTNMRSVGVMGDGRTYDYAVALRAVITDDFMTADWARIPYELLDRVSVRIVNEVKGVNRVLYDITSKPPGTVEWE